MPNDTDLQTTIQQTEQQIRENNNPDILSCIANLSNDEVFTPPNIANDVLNLLPPEIWTDPTATFLDPCSKTGVFLREIAKRLNHGLADQIPDEQERTNHILQNQIFGIAITDLTALMTRRTIYCSKTANGKNSHATCFNNKHGNIKFDKTNHTWGKQGKCTYCGANKSQFARNPDLESHAYQFIHTQNPQELFDMKFDVIIGNPPYQIEDGGGRESSARPLYHDFVTQAKKLQPRYLSMIIPARWYAGGKGLDDFRKEMLNDNSMKIIHDFPETSDVFPDLNVRGGICYFLWDKSHKENTCEIINHKQEQTISDKRPLLEDNADVFIRYNKAISILRKVQSFNENSFAERVSRRKPFSLESNHSKFKTTKTDNENIRLYRNGEDGFISLDDVPKNKDWVRKYKVFISKASPGGDEYPHQVITRPRLGEIDSCCTETYLVAGLYDDKKIAENVIKYTHTRFFRFMMILLKNTQNISQKVYQLVPDQDFKEVWTDEQLYAKYHLTQDEIKYIESMIKPMELDDE